MNKQNKSLLIAIVVAMAVIGVLLIIMLSVQSKVEDAKQMQATTEADEVVLSTDIEEDLQNSSQGKDSASADNFDYDENIKEKSQNIDKLLTINGKTFGIPCKFGELKNEFSYLEEVPETLEGGGFTELHALSGDIDTGLSLMVINTSDSAVSTNDMYVGTIILTEKTSPVDISIGGLKIGAQLEDIENFIKAGGYEYDVTETDCENIFRISIADESVSLMVVYDITDAYVYKMILEYVVS